MATGINTRTLQDHAANVASCAITPDDTLVVSASHDGTLNVWDINTGVVYLRLEGHTNWVNGCAVSRDGDLIASVSIDNTLRIWSIKTGDCLAILHTQGSLNACTWLSSDKLVAVGAHGVYFLQLVW
jgi:WD40 repeat protein